MNIGIIGSRRRDSEEDLSLVRKELKWIMLSEFSEPTLISGGCKKGGDRFAEILARELRLNIHIYPANWKKYGRIAGFQRNTYIAMDSDILIACVSEDRTGGTEDTIKKFKKLKPAGRLILV